MFIDRYVIINELFYGGKRNGMEEREKAPRRVFAPEQKKEIIRLIHENEISGFFHYCGIV